MLLHPKVGAPVAPPTGDITLGWWQLGSPLWLPRQGRHVSHHCSGLCLTEPWFPLAGFHYLFVPKGSFTERLRMDRQQCSSTSLDLCGPCCLESVHALKIVGKPLLPLQVPACLLPGRAGALSHTELWLMSSPEQDSPTQKHSTHHPCAGIEASTARTKSHQRKKCIHLQPQGCCRGTGELLPMTLFLN